MRSASALVVNEPNSSANRGLTPGAVAVMGGFSEAVCRGSNTAAGVPAGFGVTDAVAASVVAAGALGTAELFGSDAGASAADAAEVSAGVVSVVLTEPTGRGVAGALAAAPGVTAAGASAAAAMGGETAAAGFVDPGETAGAGRGAGGVVAGGGGGAVRDGAAGPM